MAYMLRNIFAEKNESSFCIYKSYSHFFGKNTCSVNKILYFLEQLTFWPLTAPLS